MLNCNSRSMSTTRLGRQINSKRGIFSIQAHMVNGLSLSYFMPLTVHDFRAGCLGLAQTMHCYEESRLVSACNFDR
jgi:hypothetical protein